MKKKGKKELFGTGSTHRIGPSSNTAQNKAIQSICRSTKQRVQPFRRASDIAEWQPIINNFLCCIYLMFYAQQVSIICFFYFGFRTFGLSTGKGGGRV